MPLPKSRARLPSFVRRLVQNAVKRFTAERGIVLLSGGVDSTIMAYLLKRQVSHLQAVVVSTDAAQSSDGISDLQMARKAAAWLGIRLHEVILTPAEVIAAVPEVIRLAETRRASIIDELSGMYALAKYVRSLGFTCAYTGEGPDDIFGGLEFQLRFTPLRRVHKAMRDNFAHELPTELAAHQKLFTDVAGVTLIHPFLYRPLVRLGFSLSPRQLVDRRRQMKLLFRQAFANEVPSEFVWRAKAITRVASGLKRIQEAHFGSTPTRYYGLHRAWRSSLTADEQDRGSGTPC
jgi:asparagine synthase (glutamine-hydrolysing)